MDYNPKDKLTREEAAIELGVSVVTLDRWRKARVISYNQIGRRVFFFRYQLDELYQRSEIKANK